VCPADLQSIDKGLLTLPRRLAAVEDALLPGKPKPGDERVAVSTHIHTRPPLNVDALSLLGPGADVTPRLHPLVRHWSARRKVLVTVHVVGRARQVEVEVTDWFHEAVIDADGRPVLVPDDDQIGTVPPREWADQTVREWRAHFGHHVPSRTQLPTQRAYVPPAYATLLRVPGGTHAVAFLAAVHAADGAPARLAYRGLLRAAPVDPILDDIERRGRPPGPQAMQWDVDYLRTWLEKAAGEPALDVAAFAAQLRALHAEISRVLGEDPDQTWIGRCPAFLAELDDDGEPTGRKKPCGGGLWQDNTAFSAQVQCPRCHMVWGTRGHEGAGTAREIRRVWPIDRRRRYSADEIDRLTRPKCPTCSNRVKIEWKDVTGTRDKQRTWQPATATCANGCDDARGVL
jgi:hypothetical protein